MTSEPDAAETGADARRAPDPVAGPAAPRSNEPQAVLVAGQEPAADDGAAEEGAAEDGAALHGAAHDGGRQDAGSRRRWAGTTGVAVVLTIAGLLFATSASTSRGTQLRSERADVADLVQAGQLRVKTRTQRVTALHAEVDRETAANAEGNDAVTSLEQSSAGLVAAAGLTPVTGPGLIVTLDDAPRDAAVPAQAGPDDLVVHQQDVQAVVNALWAGGAEAMMLQDQRVISTSAVRCVGNTLILQGRVYSPPYSITAIGDVRSLRSGLDSSPEIGYYKQYVAALRLGWQVQERRALRMPAFAGSLSLQHAIALGDAATGSGTTPAVPGSASGSTSSSSSSAPGSSAPASGSSGSGSTGVGEPQTPGSTP